MIHHDAKIHDVEQGSTEWHQCRNGILTASEVKLILTPTLKVANNEKTRAHVYELAGQRITGHTEPTYIGDEMLRGHVDEIKARELYNDRLAPVEELGFITRDIGGCIIGYSPDGAGLLDPFGIEIKSRRQKFQVQSVVDNTCPEEHILQVQAGLLVTGWDYIHYITYCGGMPMWIIECEPIPEYQEAIKSAAIKFEKKVCNVIDEYKNRLNESGMVIETERENPDTEIYFDGVA